MTHALDDERQSLLGGASAAAAAGLETYGLVIGGREVPAQDHGTFTSTDPASGVAIAAFAEAGAKDVASAVRAGQQAFEGTWRRERPRVRARVLRELAELIRKHSRELSAVECMDTGKPISAAREDINTAERYFEYYSGVADKLYGQQIPIDDGYIDFTTREPYGVVAIIIPWNFPLMIAARSIATAMAAGNTVVLKTAELAPYSCGLFARLVLEADIVPAGVVNVLHGYGDPCGAAMAAHPDVGLVTFTGSVATGRAVARQAGGNLTPVVLELGGKSPAIVLNDADLAETARQITASYTEVSGQSCDACTRVLVEAPLYDEMVRQLVDGSDGLTIGPGCDDPDLGPLISRHQLERVVDLVQSGVRDGAELVLGGDRLRDGSFADGNFMAPTILGRSDRGSSVAREEIFGPVLVVMPFERLEDAVEVANETGYGLAGSVWSHDLDRALWLAQRIEAGQVFVNCLGCGDGPAIPFGGYGKSGYGREKGLEGLRSYTRTRNVCIALDKRVGVQRSE